LIDVELQCLRGTNIRRVEMDIVSEVVDIGNDGVPSIREASRRKIADQVIVPQPIGIDGLSSNIHASGIPTLSG